MYLSCQPSFELWHVPQPVQEQISETIKTGEAVLCGLAIMVTMVYTTVPQFRLDALDRMTAGGPDKKDVLPREVGVAIGLLGLGLSCWGGEDLYHLSFVDGALGAAAQQPSLRRGWLPRCYGRSGQWDDEGWVAGASVDDFWRPCIFIYVAFQFPGLG